MRYVFGALMLAFALMQVELQAILLLVGACLVVISGWIVFRVRLESRCNSAGTVCPAQEQKCTCIMQNALSLAKNMMKKRLNAPGWCVTIRVGKSPPEGAFARFGGNSR